MAQMSVGRSGTRVLVAVIVAAALSIPGALADDDAWKVKWSNGFKLDSPDKAFQLKFGGRLQADWTFADADDDVLAVLGEEGGDPAVFSPASIVDGNEFRRARVFFSGKIYERVEFKVQYDFAGGDADFKDVYLGILDTPVGNIRIGHFKEPFSLEEQTSSKYLAFLERSLPNAFAPGRNAGVMLHDRRGDRLTWAVGAFREANDFGVTSDGEDKLNLTGRVTGLPIYEDGGKRLLHVGGGVSIKDLGDDSYRFRARPEVHQISERFVDTGSLPGDGATLYNIEVAGVFDRLWFAAEHTMARADASPLGDPSFGGSYYQVGYFLTEGDYRRYKTKAGAFDRNKPARIFGKGGPGALELAIRYSNIDLTDESISGGELTNISLALNWYLNPATRFMFNYVKSDLDRTETFPGTIGTVAVDGGGADFMLARFQVDF